MSKTFNAVCHKCEHFRPRCRKVNLKVLSGEKPAWSAPVPLCETCRRQMVGQFRYAENV